MLLKSDAGFPDEEIAEQVGCSCRTVCNLCERCCEEGVQRAIYDAPPALFPYRTKRRPFQPPVKKSSLITKIQPASQVKALPRRRASRSILVRAAATWSLRMRK